MQGCLAQTKANLQDVSYFRYGFSWILDNDENFLIYSCSVVITFLSCVSFSILRGSMRSNFVYLNLNAIISGALWVHVHFRVGRNFLEVRGISYQI